MNDHVIPIWYVLEGRNPVPAESEDHFMQWFHTNVPLRKHVLRENIISGKTITTVFHGVNITAEEKDPRVFSTAVYTNPDKPDYAVYYPSWEEADKGHLEVVRQLRTHQLVLNQEASGESIGWITTFVIILLVCGVVFSIFRG